jgi:TonB family protein
MRFSVASTALVGSFVLTPVVAGLAPALCQDFSITNQAEPADPARRDLMRDLQAWWDVHAYYPKHASNNDEGGTVKIHLNILPDGRIWMLNVVESSGSRTLDAAGLSAFRSGIMRSFPPGAPEVNMTLTLHYILAHRDDQPVTAATASTGPKRPFTIANDPVKSPVLETMLQRTCTGTVKRSGSKVRAWQGYSSWAQAIFFRKPDGTPWVKFYVSGGPSLSPVTQIGNMVQWVGPLERGLFAYNKDPFYTTYTVWADGPNHLIGAEGSPIPTTNGPGYATSLGGPIDMICDTEILPTVPYSNLLAQTQVTPGGDPP